MKGERERTPFFQLLNGDWKFQFAPTPAQAPEGFFVKRYDDLAWDDLPVPWNWQIQGYGLPRYLASSYAFDTSACPGVPADTNETGCYRTTFNIPEDWKGRQIFLVFDGVDFGLLPVGQRERSRFQPGQPPAGRIQYHRVFTPVRTAWRCASIAGRMEATWKTRICGS